MITGPDLGPNLCKGYQQMTLVGKELIKIKPHQVVKEKKTEQKSIFFENQAIYSIKTPFEAFEILCICKYY